MRISGQGHTSAIYRWEKSPGFHLIGTYEGPRSYSGRTVEELYIYPAGNRTIHTMDIQIVA